MLLSYCFEAVFFSYLITAGWLAFILFKKKKKIIPVLLVISMLGLIYSAYLEPYWVKTRYETVNIGKLNSEIKVVLVSDWHMRPGKRASFVRSAAKKIAREQPDLILVAGDHLFYDDFEKFKKDLAALGALVKIAPTYAVLGNHDHGIGNRGNTVHYADQSAKIAQVLEQNGIKVLIDAKEKVKIKGNEFWLVGFDEFWHWNKKPARAIEGLADDNLLKIGISHNPDAAFTAEGKILDLVLSGH
ncbi:MAG: metallophosphoesterase family protein, partial [Candidatus Magasanikbacteria bacterium]|nr:metallophosphoesterase family protein [Candidatus Magasanikbacteria bacterium]